MSIQLRSIASSIDFDCAAAICTQISLDFGSVNGMSRDLPVLAK